MFTNVWDVSDLMNKKVHLEIVDQKRTGPLDFIEIDHIIQSDSTTPLNLAVFDARQDVLWLEDFTGKNANGWIVKPKKLYATDQVATITSPEFEVKHDYINFRFEIKDVGRLDQLAPMSANLITEDGTIIAVGSISNDWR